MKRELRIDPDIQASLDPLKPSELRQLMENILAEGIRDPIVVWKGHDIIVDGHNRYKLAMEFDLDFEIVEMDFDDADDAKDWLQKNQLGKRNLTENQEAYLTGNIYNRRKRKEGRPGKDDKLPQLEGETAEIIAEEVGTSRATVERAGEFAQVLEVIREKAGSEIVVEIKKRSEKIPTQQLAFLAAEVEHNPQIIEQSLSTPPKLRAKANSLYRGLIYNQTKPKLGTTGFSGETVGVPAKDFMGRFGVSEDQVREDGRLANVITKVGERDESLRDWLMETPGVPIAGITKFNGDVVDLDLIKSVRSIMLKDKLPFHKAFQKAVDDNPSCGTLSEHERLKGVDRRAIESANEAVKIVSDRYSGGCLLPNVRQWWCSDCGWGFDTFVPEPGSVSCPYCKGKNLTKRDERWVPTRAK